MQRVFKSLASIALASAALVGFASPANAAHQDATVNSGEFVFFYNSNYAGSYSDFLYVSSNLANYTFIKPGLSGYQTPVKNNSASVANYKYQTARVYFNSNWAGDYDQVGPGTGSNPSGRNLVKTYNDNASFKWI